MYLRIVIVGVILVSVSNTLSADGFRNPNGTGQQWSSFPPMGGAQLVGDSILSTVGHWAWGPCVAADVKAGFIFIGNGSLLQVLQMSDSGTTNVASELSFDYPIREIILDDTLAYVCDFSNLFICSISDPLHPRQLSKTLIPTHADRMILEYPFLYAKSIFVGGLSIVDVSDPAVPVVEGSFFTGPRSFLLGVRNQIVYVGFMSDFELVLFDTRNIDSINYRTFSESGPAFCGFIKDTVLFVGGSNGRVTTFNVAKVDSPKRLVTTTAGGFEFGGILDIVGKDSLIYVGMEGGIASMASSDPSNLRWLDFVSHPLGLSYRLALEGDLLYDAIDIGLLVVDISDISEMRESAFFPCGARSTRVVAKDSLVFVTSENAGLWIVDVSQPTAPIAIANVSTRGWAADIVVEDGFAYVANNPNSPDDTSRGLWIIDIANPSRPEIVSHYRGKATRWGETISFSLTKRGDYVFMTTPSDQGVKDTVVELIDVSNPSVPVSLGVYASEISPYNTAVKDSILYIASMYAGIRLVRWLSSGDFSEVLGIAIPSQQVLVRDNIAIAGAARVYVFDVSNPMEPMFIDSVFTHLGSGQPQFSFDRDFLYWADGTFGLVDLRDPNQPVQVGVM